VSRLTLRLTLALASTVLAGVLAAAYYAHWKRTRTKVVDFQRTSDTGGISGAPGSPRSADPEAASEIDLRLPGVLDTRNPRPPPSAFPRVPLDPEEVARFFPPTPVIRYDAFSYFRQVAFRNQTSTWREHPRGAWTHRTNSIGMREDREPSVEHPDLRILVTGDSHTDGVCENSESFVHLLEADLAARHPGRTVEALNAGAGGYSFYNYLGTLERLLPLEPDAFVVTIYGGNDFEEILSLQHRFRGTQRPAGSKNYWPQIERAIEIFKPCLAQCFGSLKYFAANPDQKEIALQGARDVCTEIAVVCLRNSVRPIFVYVPPLEDVEWPLHADKLDPVREVLGLSDEDLACHEQLADSLLASLRAKRLEVVDMRAPFRAAKRPLYWAEDNHINLDAQRLIADALQPLFGPEIDDPPVRARAALGTRVTAADRARLFAPGAPTPEQIARSGEMLRIAPTPEQLSVTAFEWEPVRAAQVEALGTLAPEEQFDPVTWFRYRGGLDLDATRDGETFRLRTNSRGMRGPEPSATPAELRVLFLGGESFDAPRDAEQGLAAAITAELVLRRPGETVEGFDASHRRHSFHQHFGAYLSARDLSPRLVVLAVDGDDFAAASRATAILHGEKIPTPEPPPAGTTPELAGALSDALWFEEHPGEERMALAASVAATQRLSSTLLAQSARLLVLYFPPNVGAAALAPHIAARGGRPENPIVTARIGASYLGAVRDREIEALNARTLLFDARPDLRAPTVSWHDPQCVRALARAVAKWIDGQKLLPAR
jgi:hypothetical protein